MRPSKPLVWTAILMLLPQLTGCYSWKPADKVLPEAPSPGRVQISGPMRVQLLNGQTEEFQSGWIDSKAVGGEKHGSQLEPLVFLLSDVQSVRIKRFSLKKTVIYVPVIYGITLGALVAIAVASGFNPMY